MWTPPRNNKELELSISDELDFTTIELHGTLNDLTVNQLENTLKHLLVRDHIPKTIFISCEQLLQISSSGLAFLIRAFQECLKKDVSIELINACGHIRESINMIQMDRIMHRLKHPATA